MGSANSKSRSQRSYSDASQIKTTAYNNNCSSSIHRAHSCQSTSDSKFNDNGCQQTNRKEISCKKKKVLILGLDGVGKTELFTRLISYNKKKLKVDTLPRPTLGYNVETIQLRCRHMYHIKEHQITLWDCGGHPFMRSLWSYHFSNTSLLVWLINIHDRSRLDTNIHLLLQVLLNPMLHQVPVLIILYNSPFDSDNQENSNSNIKQNLLTNLEVSFRFLATLSTSHASTFKWQVINIKHDTINIKADVKKLQQKFIELMEL